MAGVVALLVVGDSSGTSDNFGDVLVTIVMMLMLG